MRTREGLLQVVPFISLFLIILFSSTKSYCADTNAVAYFPMKVGNVYVYKYEFNSSFSHETYNIQARITKDTLMNNKVYYYLSGFPIMNNNWYRVDTITGSLYKFDSTNPCPNYYKEVFQDSLSAIPGDISTGCGNSNLFHCDAITPVIFFSINTFQKNYTYSYGIGYQQLYFNKLIGFTRYYSHSSTPFSQSEYGYNLLGCVVNNVLYGDTTFTVIPFTQLNLTSPASGITITTSSNDTTKIIFSWSSSLASTSVKYKWKIKKSPVGSYLYFPSDSSGYAKQITVRKSKLDSLANYFGIINDSIQCAWSCIATLGSDSALSDVRVINIRTNTVSIKNISSEIPSQYKLFYNYPNPFNPTTNIKFDVPNTSYVRLIIYDALGKELSRLINESLNAGSYNYQWDASNFTSGVYFYRLETDDFIDTKKMVLLK